MYDQVLPGVPLRLWQQVEDADHRLLMLDYDGTLSPHRIEPAEAVPHARSLELARKIARSAGTSLAIVSGRPTRALESLLGPLPAWLVGEHGWEVCSPSGAHIRHPLPEPLNRALDEAANKAIEQGWSDRLERKRASVVIHTGGIPAVDSTAIERACEVEWRGPASTAGLRLTRVNGGIELRAGMRDKGTAVADLMHLSPFGTFPVYVGDDEPDEDAFAELIDYGLGIRVGREDRESFASGRLETLDSVADFLESWLALVEGREHTRRSAS